jgi:hypothetical protein
MVIELVYTFSQERNSMDPKTQEQLIDELVKGYKGPESFWGETGIFSQLKKKIIERTLHAEMDDHPCPAAGLTPILAVSHLQKDLGMGQLQEVPNEPAGVHGNGLSGPVSCGRDRSGDTGDMGRSSSHHLTLPGAGQTPDTLFDPIGRPLRRYTNDAGKSNGPLHGLPTTADWSCDTTGTY